MIKKWKRLEVEVGTATPGDPIPATHGYHKLLRCPLCFYSCSDIYWNRIHSKQLHQICPIRRKWFLANYGLGQHFTKTQCGLILLGAIENTYPMETIVVNYVRS